MAASPTVQVRVQVGGPKRGYRAVKDVRVVAYLRGRADGAPGSTPAASTKKALTTIEVVRAFFDCQGSVGRAAGVEPTRIPQGGIRNAGSSNAMQSREVCAR